MQKAGYPFHANDLTLDEWLDLAVVKEALEQPSTCPLVGEQAKR